MFVLMNESTGPKKLEINGRIIFVSDKPTRPISPAEMKAIKKRIAEANPELPQGGRKKK